MVSAWITVFVISFKHNNLYNCSISVTYVIKTFLFWASILIFGNTIIYIKEKYYKIYYYFYKDLLFDYMLKYIFIFFNTCLPWEILENVWWGWFRSSIVEDPTAQAQWYPEGRSESICSVLLISLSRIPKIETFIRYKYFFRYVLLESLKKAKTVWWGSPPVDRKY